MDLLIQHEFYREVLGDSRPGRLVEADAAAADADDEKVHEDEEMWGSRRLPRGDGTRVLGRDPARPPRNPAAAADPGDARHLPTHEQIGEIVLTP